MTAINDHFQVRVSGLCLGIAWNNIWWYVTRTNPSNANLANALADMVRTKYNTILPSIHVETTIDNIDVTNWDNPSEVGSNGIQSIGTASGAAMPSYIAYKLQYARTAAGRNYPLKSIPGVEESLTTGNELNVGTATALGVFALDMVQLELTSGAEVDMFAINPVPPLGLGNWLWTDPPYKIQNVTALRRVFIGTQRSRLP